MARKRIAFIFTQGPHGSSAGREGLDALLATSALSEDIGVFFISDGVLQLLPQQQPEKNSCQKLYCYFRCLTSVRCRKLLSLRTLIATAWVE